MRTRLLLLTDRSQLRLGRGLVRTVRECADAGATHVVVREHDLSPVRRHALVDALVAIDGLTVISSRVPDPAAGWLHLAADQPAPASGAGMWSPSARHEACAVAITPRYKRFGRSCHTVDEVRRAAAEGAAYATLSPYAETSSKPGYGPALGPAVFGESPLPVFALGGVHPGNARAALDAGAHGVAVMGSVMRATEPAGVVRELLEEVR